MNLPRAVAVDMDGTFLRPDMDYDRERFALLRQVLTEAGCRFVVASGNQYAQLASFFDAPERLSFVAENGGLVVDAGTLVHVTVLDAEAISAALDAFDELPDADVALCGVRSAYLRFPDARSRPQLSPYYHRLTTVDDLRAVDDRIVKITAVCPPAATPAVMAHLMPRVAGRLMVTSSGHGSVDLIAPGAHKAAGLRVLTDAWGVDLADVVAFGDGGNDLELLRACGRSFAMANGSPACLAAATDVAPPNSSDGVLVALEALFHTEG